MECGHGHALADRRLERARVRLEVRDDRVARHESVRIVARICAARKSNRPVRRDEAEGVPASTPGLADASALQDNMVHAGGRQLVAHGETGLPGADHDDIWFGHWLDAMVGSPDASR